MATALAALGGCGGDNGGDAAPAGQRSVRASVDLGRPGGGAPDAGTAMGHGADLAVATTSRGSLRFGGKVSPPDADVALVDQRDGDSAAAEVGAGGRFRLRATDLRPGINRFRIEARKRGHRPWRLDVRITRTP